MAAFVLFVAPLYIAMIITLGEDGKDLKCYFFNCGSITMTVLLVPLTGICFLETLATYEVKQSIEIYLQKIVPINDCLREEVTLSPEILESESTQLLYL